MTEHKIIDSDELESPDNTPGPSWKTVTALFIVCLTVVAVCYIVRVT